MEMIDIKNKTYNKINIKYTELKYFFSICAPYFTYTTKKGCTELTIQPQDIIFQY